LALKRGVARLRFNLKASKYDLLAIFLLCIIFLSIASYNLGSSTVPTTTVKLQNGQSFYVDLGTKTNVTVILFLIKSGGINVSISVGSPANWIIVQSNVAYPNATATSTFDKLTIVYNEWYAIGVVNQTQYLKVDVNKAVYPTEITEIDVLDQDYQQVQIQSITNVGAGNPNLHNLIDEQSLIQLSTFYMVGVYFDEFLYVQTAEQFLNYQQPTEWTNPPLGKIIISAGIALFGLNPFGWRIMGVIFATLMIPLMYFLGKKLLGTWIGGFSAAFLLTFDFMHFTMARMATLDTYMVFFSLASQLCFLIYIKGVFSKGWKTSVVPLFLATLFFALGFSSKWLAILGFAAEISILAVLRFKDVLNLKSKSFQLKVAVFFARPFAIFIGFMILAVAIYFASFTPMLLSGSSIGDIFKLQLNMAQFHGVLAAQVPIAGASPWYSWPFMFNPSGTVPLLLEAPVGLANGFESIIVVLGNPAVWWVGFAAVFLLLFYFFKVYLGNNRQEKKNTFPLLFILVFFFFQWIPYLFLTRTTFVYYFYSNVPFMALASAFFINKIWKDNWGKIMVIIYFIVVAVMFVLFYPLISGAPTSTNTIDSLHIFGNWKFTA
jgi:dolichyl-phosphate-mannose-protein mannosyltransferase